MEWTEVEARLQTATGKAMAKEVFKEDLPLHMACERKAPETTILGLLDAFPDGAAVPGRYGGHPLHLAAQQKLSPKILVALIRAYPEALDQEDDSSNLPRDYSQRNDLNKEALCRPTACWIEDLEKEDFMNRIDRKKAQVRQKINLLRTALDTSEEKREDLKQRLKQLGPRMQAQRDVVRRLGELEKQLDGIKLKNDQYIVTVNDRIKTLSEEASTETDEEEARMKSLMRRTYMQSVQRQYEKLINRTDQIRKDLQVVRSEVAARRKASDDGSATADSGGGTQ